MTVNIEDIIDLITNYGYYEYLCGGANKIGRVDLESKYLDELIIRKDNLIKAIKEYGNPSSLTADDYNQYHEWLRNNLKSLGYTQDNMPDNVPSIEHWRVSVKHKGKFYINEVGR